MKRTILLLLLVVTSLQVFAVSSAIGIPCKTIYLSVPWPTRYDNDNWYYKCIIEDVAAVGKCEDDKYFGPYWNQYNAFLTGWNLGGETRPLTHRITMITNVTAFTMSVYYGAYLPGYKLVNKYRINTRSLINGKTYRLHRDYPFARGTMLFIE